MGGLALTLMMAAAAPAEESPGPEQQQPEARFDVWEYAISGNAVLDTRAIEKAVYPFLGPNRTVGDVEFARRALETLYKDAGYGTVVVTIPEQDVNEGLVRLEVLEGKVDRLVVTGATYYSPLRIKNAVPALAKGEVPELPKVQQELLALNSTTADRRITPVLRAGRYPGTVEAELKVDDSLPLHGNLEVNNEYTRDTTHTRVSGLLSYDNFWQREHSLGLGFQTAPENRDEVSVLFGTYTARFQGSPWLVSGYYIDSDSDVASLGTLGVVGKGKIAGLRFIRPLPILAGGFQRATFGLDYKDFDENVALTGGQGAIETPIQYGTMSADWGITFAAEGRTTTLDVLAVFGAPFFGNDPTEFENKRAGATPNFAYLGVNVSLEQQLPADFRLRLAGRGQLADSPLISNEQFSFGGAASVRGYLEAQQFVDNGASAQLELLSPNWGHELLGMTSGRLLAFVDAGGGMLQDPLPEQDDSFFLWSAGLGFRAVLWNHLTPEFDWAYPLEDTADGSVQAGDSRWHFKVRYGF